METGLTTVANLERVDWGERPYREALEDQLKLVAQRLAGQIGDTLAFTHHPPVYTIGRRRDADRHLLAHPDFLARHGIEVVATNRGGDITYHGPGQIVGYLIFDLRPRRDLHRFLRLVEQALVATVCDLGLAARLREGKTGVWIADRKIAAIGMAARQWVSFHGFALNLDPDLSHFEGIVPCGIRDGTVTSLARELPQPPPANQCKDLLHRHLRDHLSSYAG